MPWPRHTDPDGRTLRHNPGAPVGVPGLARCRWGAPGKRGGGAGGRAVPGDPRDPSAQVRGATAKLPAEPGSPPPAPSAANTALGNLPARSLDKLSHLRETRQDWCCSEIRFPPPFFLWICISLLGSSCFQHRKGSVQVSPLLSQQLLC